MCEFLIFNTQKRYEKQKNFGNFSATFWKFSQFSATFLKKIAFFWQLLDTFIGNFFGIHRQLVAKPILSLLPRVARAPRSFLALCLVPLAVSRKK